MYLESDELIIGADECGLGSIAGPLVVCAAACVKAKMRAIVCEDSKQYDGNYAKMQKAIAASEYLCYKVIEVCADDLCRWGYPASLSYAYRLAVESVRYALRPHYPHAIIDGVNDQGVRFSKTYIKADKNWPIVSLASCLGKCSQLRTMYALHARFPEYHFNTSAGYGTSKHVDAIRVHGMLPHIHRIPIIAKMNGMHDTKTRKDTDA